MKNTTPLTKSHQQTIERKKANRKIKRQLIAAASQPHGSVLDMAKWIVGNYQDLLN